jgi:hypothetical protein
LAQDIAKIDVVKKTVGGQAKENDQDDERDKGSQIASAASGPPGQSI